MAPALVIDDDLGLLRSLEQAARLSGIRIVTASTWDAGLETFQALSPSVVIADFNMPGSRHGFQLLARIRQLRPSVRLILVSAYLDEKDIEAVMELGVVDRALTKGSSAETAEAVLEEARSAVEREETPTDWVAYAKAFLDAGAIPEDAFNRLDDLLVRKVEDR
jgi:DNA-binding NtrC family response regulator